MKDSKLGLKIFESKKHSERGIVKAVQDVRWQGGDPVIICIDKDQFIRMIIESQDSQLVYSDEKDAHFPWKWTKVIF